MPTYKKRSLIQNLQQQTEQILQTAISEWQMTNTDLMLQQPGKDKWSAAQCLEHLNTYGNYYLPAIEKAIISAAEFGPHTNAQFTSGWLGNYFYQMMLPKDGKMKKMSSPKDHRPKADLDSDAVISEFIEQQEKLLKLLEEAKDIDLNKVKVAISIAPFIKLKLGDVFLFLIAHNLRHVLQAQRALGKAIDHEQHPMLSSSLQLA